MAVLIDMLKVWAHRSPSCDARAAASTLSVFVTAACGFSAGFLAAFAPHAFATCVAPIVFAQPLESVETTGSGPALNLVQRVEGIKVVSTRASSTFNVCLVIADDESVIPGTHLQCAEESVDAFK